MNNAPPNKKCYGFTLIELMIVVAVVGILASVAYPSYLEHVRRTNRAEAKTILLEMAQLLERNFTEANRYDLNSAGNAFVLPTAQSPKTGTAKYTVQFATAMPTQNSYTLEAVPVGAMADDDCATLTLTHTGIRGVAGNPKLTAVNCWQR
jgi:type IV pilus assembly protein PilE